MTASRLPEWFEQHPGLVAIALVEAHLRDDWADWERLLPDDWPKPGTPERRAADLVVDGWLWLAAVLLEGTRDPAAALAACRELALREAAPGR